MAENFDHLLAVEHLLNVAVHGSHRGLLTGEALNAFPGDDQGDHSVDEGHGHHAHGQGPAVVDHDHKGGDSGDQAGDELSQGVADKLAQSVCVVGIMTHNVAVGVGVKIGDGQALHVVEHVIPNVF